MDITAAYLDVEKNVFEAWIKNQAEQYKFKPADINVTFGKTWRGSEHVPHVQFVSGEQNLKEMAVFGLAVAEQFKTGLSIANKDTDYYDGMMVTRNKDSVALILADRNKKTAFFEDIRQTERDQGREYSLREFGINQDREDAERQQRIAEQNKLVRDQGFSESTRSHQEMLQRNALYD